MLDTSSTIAAKRRLREASKRMRAEAFASLGRIASETIAERGIDFAHPWPGTIVSGFAAIGEEIDPLPLMLRLRNEGCQLALPVMQGRAEPLNFRRWEPGDAMAETVWGIREPLPIAPDVEPDIMLVPLLAFDAEGYRLGYGGGYYDRTLAAARAVRPVIAIGLAYDAQEVPAVPRNDDDQRLDWVLTPSGPRKCGLA